MGNVNIAVLVMVRLKEFPAGAVYLSATGVGHFLEERSFFNDHIHCLLNFYFHAGVLATSL